MLGSCLALFPESYTSVCCLQFITAMLDEFLAVIYALTSKNIKETFIHLKKRSERGCEMNSKLKCYNKNV